MTGRERIYDLLGDLAGCSKRFHEHGLVIGDGGWDLPGVAQRAFVTDSN